ncbi:selenium metabolism-associated LysR family transcriptional regulator [Desulfoplanes sp.]
MMDTRRLEAFVKVYESRSFSKAGKELFLSQPTISSHVALLEDDLGVLLFDRVGRNVLPTQAGEILYDRAQGVFRGMEMARAEIDLLRHAVSGPLIIGGSTIPADYILPKILGGFMRNYPDVNVDLRVGDTGAVIDMVGRGDVMLGLVGSSAEHNELSFEPVVSDDLVVIGAPGLVANVQNWQGEDMVKKTSWVMREPGSGTRKALASSLRKIGLGVTDMRVSIQVQNTQAMLGCVVAGLGLSVTSRMVATPYIQRGDLALLAIPDLVMARDFYLVHHCKREKFPATQRFQEYLRETIPEYSAL